MGLFIVAPTEPPAIKALAQPDGSINMLPEKMGCDVIWHVQDVWWGVQRKELKDFIQSVGDGRIAREIAQMRAYEIPMPTILIEGRLRWSDTDELMWNGRRQTITRASWRGMIWGIRNEGVSIEYTEDHKSTVEYVQMFARWSAKDRHGSIMRRPGPVNYWGKATNEDFAVHLLQGFDGIGVDKARAIVRHFGGVPLLWSVTEKDLRGVPGLGKILARKLIEALEYVHEQGEIDGSNE